MKNRNVGDMTTVQALNQDDTYVFVSDSQDVASVRATVANTEGYDSFFVRTGDGEYLEVWGMCGIVPYNSKLISRLA